MLRSLRRGLKPRPFKALLSGRRYGCPPALMGWRRLWSGLRCRCTGGGEVYLRDFARSWGRFEVGFIGFESGYTSEEAVGELLDVGVVILQGVVVALPFDSDAVLGAGEFVLQSEEVFVGFQLRIILDDHKQAAECSIELAVGSDFLLGCAGGKQGRAGFGDVAEDCDFLLGVTLHSLHEVGD